MGRSIHIAVVPTLATTWLIPRLPDFQRAHPDITVSLSVRTLPFQFRTSHGALYHGDGLWHQARCCSPRVGAGMRARAGPRITGRGAEALAGLTHLHLSSRPDAWRQWYAPISTCMVRRRRAGRATNCSRW